MIKSIKYYFLTVGILLCALSINSQEYSLNQKSPQSTVFKHLYYLQEDTYNPVKAGEVFGTEAKNKSNLAIELKQIFDAHGQ